MFMVTMFMAVMVPLEIGFSRLQAHGVTRDAIDITEWAVLGIFWLDILVCFRWATRARSCTYAWRMSAQTPMNADECLHARMAALPLHAGRRSLTAQASSCAQAGTWR